MLWLFKKQAVLNAVPVAYMEIKSALKDIFVVLWKFNLRASFKLCYNSLLKFPRDLVLLSETVGKLFQRQVLVRNFA